jgi:hypothetical protein
MFDGTCIEGKNLFFSVARIILLGWIPIMNVIAN